MRKSQLINEQLMSFDYYKRKLPLYLQNSYGFVEHFKIWYDILAGSKVTTYPSGLSEVANTLLYCLNIFDKDYLDILNSIYEEDVKTSDILDKIGALFGLKRRLTLPKNASGDDIQTVVTLDDNDFLIFIRSQIVKNYDDGSYLQMKEYYEMCGLNVFIVTIENEPANCRLVLNYAEGTDLNYSENLRALFYSGLLTIRSMGIQYVESIIDLANLLYWEGVDKNGNSYFGNNTWDGRWLETDAGEAGGVWII